LFYEIKLLDLELRRALSCCWRGCWGAWSCREHWRVVVVSYFSIEN